MKYAFVTLSIISIWIAILIIIMTLNYEGIVLPLIGLAMTLLLFEIGFGGKK